MSGSATLRRHSSCRKATIRCMAPVRSSGNYQARALDPLAMRVLEGEFREGDRVTVDVGDNGIDLLK